MVKCSLDFLTKTETCYANFLHNAVLVYKLFQTKFDDVVTKISRKALLGVFPRDERLSFTLH